MYATRKLLKQLTLIMIVVNLMSCASGMPIGPQEILPMTQQQVVTGVASVFNGSQPIAFMFERASGLRVLFWPGATDGATTLWNFVCLQNCAPGWQSIGNGFAMTGARASEFAQYLQDGGWQQVAPVTAGVTAEGMTLHQWLQFAGSTLTGFMIVIPAGIVPPQPTEVRL